jgi:hypothetical protein
MGFGIDGIGADLMGVFSHRRDVIDEKVARELVPRFQAEYGRAPNQRELASLMDKANLRTRKGKDGVIDWDAATRGWQAKAAQKAGVDLTSLYRRVSGLERNGCAPHDAGPELTQDEITRAAQKALEKCSREDSKWMRADLVANLGRELPRRAGDPAQQAALLSPGVAGETVYWGGRAASQARPAGRGRRWVPAPRRRPRQLRRAAVITTVLS